MATTSTYTSVIERLSKASVDKHWEAYADIPWEDPDFAVDPADPRWILPPIDRLGRHPWYQAQPPEVQAQIGLWRVATAMKIGLQFENLLKRGLLTYAYRLPNSSPEFRYVYHETTEEAHHGMMFQEFVNRSGLPIRGMPRALDVLAQVSPHIPRISTELFFVFVLGGEDPIDYVQRKTLKDSAAHLSADPTTTPALSADPTTTPALHPLLETIMRIHVAEEARHISFARHYLRHQVPKMNPIRRRTLAALAPLILGLMARIMLSPPGPMIHYFDIPADVVRDAYGDAEFKGEIRACVAKVRELAGELGLIDPVTRRLWRAMGIWEAPAAGPAAGPAGPAAKSAG